MRKTLHLYTMTFNKTTAYPAVTAVAAGRYDRNDYTKSGLYQTMIMEE